MIQLHIPFNSHPATRQDEWVVDRTVGRHGGIFVDIGAHDGLRYSNTLVLEEHFGWTGLLVEPDPNLFDKLAGNRKNCKAVRCAIADRFEQDAPFAFGDAYGGLINHLPEDWKKEHSSRRTPIGVVSTLPLSSLLEQTGMPEVIDFLSLDVEGAEWPILYSFFRSQRPNHVFRMMTVEFRYDQLLLERLVELLGTEGYYLDEVRGFDACFIHSEFGP